MKKILLLLVTGICLGVVFSIGGAEIIERTSGDAFCSSCHSMEPMTAAYHESVHGGNNSIGFKAKCADCHLPHDNVVTYLTAKAYTGAKDVLGELFWVENIDWIKHLEKREEFTYSSGCRKCHHLKEIKYQTPKAFLAHRDLLEGEGPSCIRCHEHVGHKNIKAYL